MSKRRHHYVPKFYLNAFGGSEKRINLVNLERLQPIRDVSIKANATGIAPTGPPTSWKTRSW